MSFIFYLFVAGGLLGLLALALHVAMIVLGFRTSVKWGLVGLLVPGGSLVFALARSGRRAMALIFLAAIIGCAGITAATACLTARSSIGAVEAAVAGLKEFEAQTEQLTNIESIDLDLGGED